MNFKFWQGKKVLLTGHTGFKGSWLGAWLSLLGARVSGLSLPAVGEPNHFRLLQADYEHHEGDIRDLAGVERVMRNSQPEFIFHLAAQSLVQASYADPIGTYQTNVMGTMNILDAARRLPSLRAAVMITSDKCYENRETLEPYRESDALGGYDPYSSSKGCAEILTASMRRSYFTDAQLCLIASARAGNVIGGGDWAESRLLPDIARGFALKKTIRIRNPEAVRPWQHVLDPLSGYLQLGEQLYQGKVEFAKGWNFGPALESALPVSAIVERCKERLPSIHFEVESSLRHEAKLLTLDSTQARCELQWAPVWPIEQALDHTLEWYRSFYEQGKILTVAQIEQYMKDASAVC